MRSLIKLPFLPVTFFNSGKIKMSVEKFLMIVGNTRYLTLNVVGWWVLRGRMCAL